MAGDSMPPNPETPRPDVSKIDGQRPLGGGRRAEPELSDQASDEQQSPGRTETSPLLKSAEHYRDQRSVLDNRETEFSPEEVRPPALDRSEERRSPTDLYREGRDHIARSEASQAEKADAFETLTTGIAAEFGDEWTAGRGRGTDGSDVFAGRQGEALVFAPGGGVYRGQINASEVRFSTMDQDGTFVYDVMYDALKEVRGE